VNRFPSEGLGVFPRKPRKFILWSYSPFISKTTAHWRRISLPCSSYGGFIPLCMKACMNVLIFLRRKVPGQTGARTRDLHVWYLWYTCSAGFRQMLVHRRFTDVGIIILPPGEKDTRSWAVLSGCYLRFGSNFHFQTVFKGLKSWTGMWSFPYDAATSCSRELIMLWTHAWSIHWLAIWIEKLDQLVCASCWTNFRSCYSCWCGLWIFSTYMHDMYCWGKIIGHYDTSSIREPSKLS
jgi:hypothetical protein